MIRVPRVKRGPARSPRSSNRLPVNRRRSRNGVGFRNEESPQIPQLNADSNNKTCVFLRHLRKKSWFPQRGLLKELQIAASLRGTRRPQKLPLRGLQPKTRLISVEVAVLIWVKLSAGAMQWFVERDLWCRSWPAWSGWLWREARRLKCEAVSVAWE